jgi:hypothetical protein
MKKIILILASALLPLFMVGCAKIDPIAYVKGSTLDIDKSVTIGNAFDNYKYFKSVSWEAGEDEQKRQIVTFKGVYDLNKCAGLAYTDTGIDAQELTPEKIAKALQLNPGLEYSFVVQFKLAVDGNSFEIGFCGLHVSQIVDGKPDETDIPDDDNKGLQAIYQNAPSGRVVNALGMLGDGTIGPNGTIN